MKKVFLAFAVVAALAACNNESDSSKVVTKDSSSTVIKDTMVKSVVTDTMAGIKKDTPVTKVVIDTAKKHKM